MRLCIMFGRYGCRRKRFNLCDKKEESKVISIPTWALLIEHRNGKILFDTVEKTMSY